jgi:hypothetical protein
MILFEFLGGCRPHPEREPAKRRNQSGIVLEYRVFEAEPAGQPIGAVVGYLEGMSTFQLDVALGELEMPAKERTGGPVTIFGIGALNGASILTPPGVSPTPKARWDPCGAGARSLPILGRGSIRAGVGRDAAWRGSSVGLGYWAGAFREPFA